VTRKSILVVEDNEVNMKLIRVLLKRGDYEVYEATDAEQGMKIARDHLPDLVLMDVQLPGMDGLSAVGMMKQEPGLKHINVIAVTAHAMAGDAEKALEVGCAGYLPKPINTRTFLAEIARFLPT
jgi:CheY-like chemotaxis protein